MNKQKNWIIGLGAAALLLATSLIVAACQSTRIVGEQKAMMEKEAVIGEQLNKDCPCVQQGKKCECEHSDCGGFSCGGEGSKGMCGADSVKE